MRQQKHGDWRDEQHLAGGSMTCGWRPREARTASTYRISEDSPDVGYDDTADHTKTGNNDGALTNKMHGDLHTLDNTAAITAEQAATRIEATSAEAAEFKGLTVQDQPGPALYAASRPDPLLLPSLCSSSPHSSRSPNS